MDRQTDGQIVITIVITGTPSSSMQGSNYKGREGICGQFFLINRCNWLQFKQFCGYLGECFETYFTRKKYIIGSIFFNLIHFYFKLLHSLSCLNGDWNLKYFLVQANKFHIQDILYMWIHIIPWLQALSRGHVRWMSPRTRVVHLSVDLCS